MSYSSYKTFVGGWRLLSGQVQLVFTHEDLSSDTNIHVKIRMCASLMLVLRDWRQEARWGLLTDSSQGSKVEGERAGHSASCSGL